MGGTASRTDDYPVDEEQADADIPGSLPETPPALHLGVRKDSSLANISLTEFKWTFGGHSVYVTGAWDDWRFKSPLTRSSPADFTTVLAVPAGTFQYKFIVDGNWKYALQHPFLFHHACTCFSAIFSETS